MYMVDEKILVSRSSDKILLFRRDFDKVTKETKWINYHIISVSGVIFFIKGNIRFQVTTIDEIYIYKFDFDTMVPALENVMYNFM